MEELTLVLIGYAIAATIFILTSNGGRYRRPAVVLESSTESDGLGCLIPLALAVLVVILLALGQGG